MVANNIIKDFDSMRYIKEFTPEYANLKIDLDLRVAGVVSASFYIKSSKLVFHIQGKRWDIIVESPHDYAHIYDESEQALLDHNVDTQRIQHILDYIQSAKQEIEMIIKYYNDNAMRKGIDR